MAIPYDIRAAMFSPSTAEGIVAIITIDKPGWANPLRFTGYAKQTLSDDPFRQGLIHGGQEYTYAVVTSERADDVPGESGTIPVVIENIEQDIGGLAKESINDLTVTLKHVALSDPDVVIEEFPAFSVLDCAADSDGGTLSMTLSMDPMDDEPGTTIRYTPDMFGGLFP